MIYIICYDVMEDDIRRDVVKYLESFSYRVQGSVFICENPHMKVRNVRKELLQITKNSEKVALLIAPLGGGSITDVWMMGNKEQDTEDCVLV